MAARRLSCREAIEARRSLSPALPEVMQLSACTSSIANGVGCAYDMTAGAFEATNLTVSVIFGDCQTSMLQRLSSGQKLESDKVSVSGK